MEDQTLHQIYDFDAPPAIPPAERTRLLGGKGNNLVVMANELGLPVPPGFTITSQVCTAYLEHGWPPDLDQALRAHMERLGERVGRRFGDQVDPLLVSVRSGAPVSMPGMMGTVLNLGLNDATASRLARITNDHEFAADCLRRFRQSYRDVIGASEVPEDPWLQLRSAIEAVFRSWNSDRAIAYRRHERIADDLGTAVTVQAMVFGNRGPDSGTGVLFTRNPSTGEPTLYGDIMFRAQGEDVVAGGHAPLPLSDLDERLPDVAAELKGYADLLERHQADLCDIEFTVEQGRLWMLQVRVGKRSPSAALRMAIDMAEDESFPLSREEAVRRVAAQLANPPSMFVRTDDGQTPIATGLPASPGVATGAIATSSDAAEAMAAAGQSVILVRTETSPEDVGGMSRSVGVLTARGGLASHAAVVARGWGIPAVVGAAAIRLSGDGVAIDGRSLNPGDELTIDGSTGEVYAGRLGGRTEIVPEAATLLAWAAELGIEIGTDAATSDAADTSSSAERAIDASQGELTADDVVRALQIKGLVTLDQLTESLAARPDGVQSLVERLKGDGLVEDASSGFRLSANGKLNALDLFRADRSSIGEERSGSILEQFHSLDRRMKDIVTAWQVRDLAGEQVLNDHSDAAYDARVLDDLASLHAETTEWLSPLSLAMKRFETYRSRLARASELARGGDQRFVASPRVDSYHSVWFELHED
ncbi:MAG: pyruvate, phosphate dikinase, partial [Chloroflexi bacterium]|nr:pyruvate, phosphate dikinase [Chloroflexota bacterium]